MDFDLFEEEDDDLLTEIELNPQQNDNESVLAPERFPEFQCIGEDSKYLKLSKLSFLNKNLTFKFSTQNNKLLDIKFSNYEFQRSHLTGSAVLKFLFGEVCMNIQYLLASVRSPTTVFKEHSYYEHRHQVTLFYHMMLHINEIQYSPIICKELESIRQLLNRITDEKTWENIHLAHSSKGNECISPAYHLLHGLLEWKVLDLFLLQKCVAIMSKEDKQNSLLFHNQILRVFDDLIICSLHLYTKKKSVDLIHHSTFSCPCFKEFWMILYVQLRSSVQTEIKECFWVIFNKAMLTIKNSMDRFSLNVLNFCEFYIWLLSGVSNLIGNLLNSELNGAKATNSSIKISENNEFIDQCVQQYLNANPTEQQLRIFICILSSTLIDWWSPRINIPILLWDYFHKKLNTTFYIAGEAPSKLAVVCNSGYAYLEKYRLLLSINETDANLTSYTQFTIFLGKILGALIKNNQHHQAQKLLGRIYSKFSVQKFLALNESGIHHIIELFFILSLSGDFLELAPKVREKLLTISLEKITNNKQIVVMKGHVALLILHTEHRIDLKEYVPKLLQQLRNVQNNLKVSKIIAESLLDIYDRSVDFRHGEHLLIDSWLPNFLNNCTSAEQERSLEALHLIFVKLDRRGFVDDTHEELLKSLRNHILPFIKQQYVNNYNSHLPLLAADFCIYSCKTGDTINLRQLFNYFIEVNTHNRQATPIFLLKILSSDKSVFVDDSILMHIWLKSLVLLTSHNEHVVALTNHVVQSQTFNYMTGLEPNDLLLAKEPLCVFISEFGKLYESCSNYEKRCQLADNFNAYLRNFEKWLPADLKNENMDVTLRFYSFLAIVIYNCPQIVYVKSKITCFFHISMTRFILPTKIQLKKSPDGNLAILVHKIWPVLVQGIGKLQFKTDSYLNKTLTDLIEKWTPHFKISPNSKTVARPFIACLLSDNHELSVFVFEKLSVLFLVTHRRQADPNACLIITIYQEIINEIFNSKTCETLIRIQRLQTFIQATCLVALEHIMMVDEIVPSHSMLLDFFKLLLNSTLYRSSNILQDLFKDYLCTLTKKHLAYNTFFFFELLVKLTQISFIPIEQIMDFLLKEICVVEEKRGGGKDYCIRGQLCKLKEIIDRSKKKENT